jgi:hypothetical protein
VRSQRGSHASGKGFCLTFFEIFDYPEIAINCTRRIDSATPLQSLALTNSRFMQEQSRHFAQRVIECAGEEALTQGHIELAFLLALGRMPTGVELQNCQEYFQAQTEVYQQLGSPPSQAAQQALAGLCSILLASNEFLYIG